MIPAIHGMFSGGSSVVEKFYANIGVTAPGGNVTQWAGDKGTLFAAGGSAITLGSVPFDYIHINAGQLVSSAAFGVTGENMTLMFIVRNFNTDDNIQCLAATKTSGSGNPDGTWAIETYNKFLPNPKNRLLFENVAGTTVALRYNQTVVSNNTQLITVNQWFLLTLEITGISQAALFLSSFAEGAWLSKYDIAAMYIASDILAPTAVIALEDELLGLYPI